ncbi:hypothetical protein [Cellulomonas edaphi]|uniref:Flp family type IVb pilin n=1 Tax=Cellulomonas edaphi TaxID=3053468 RepID=A0ABT7S6K6_9CELL|nr:hypothetical protein [Cellulomons edaphi]MDM7831255.1 hypothetical protein [Cellulomons edaphi]
MFSLSPLTPQGFMLMELRRRFARARSTEDLGASAIEWVIITGILVLLTAFVGKIIYDKVVASANNLDTDPAAPGGP